METPLKTGFAQIFSCCPKNLSCPNFGGAAAPLAPPARTPMAGTPGGNSTQFHTGRLRPGVQQTKLHKESNAYMQFADKPSTHCKHASHNWKRYVTRFLYRFYVRPCYIIKARDKVCTNTF